MTLDALNEQGREAGSLSEGSASAARGGGAS